MLTHISSNVHQNFTRLQPRHFLFFTFTLHKILHCFHCKTTRMRQINDAQIEDLHCIRFSHLTRIVLPWLINQIWAEKDTFFKRNTDCCLASILQVRCTFRCKQSCTERQHGSVCLWFLSFKETQRKKTLLCVICDLYRKIRTVGKVLRFVSVTPSGSFSNSGILLRDPNILASALQCKSKAN